MAKAKNDKAWETICDDYDIVKIVEEKGLYEIEAETICR
ncbi:type II restriction enzyme [Aneurinibacillus migulanus]